MLTSSYIHNYPHLYHLYIHIIHISVPIARAEIDPKKECPPDISWPHPPSTQASARREIQWYQNPDSDHPAASKSSTERNIKKCCKRPPLNSMDSYLSAHKYWGFYGAICYIYICMYIYIYIWILTCSPGSFHEVLRPVSCKIAIPSGHGAQRARPGWWWSTDRGVDIASPRPAVRMVQWYPGWCWTSMSSQGKP